MTRTVKSIHNNGWIQKDEGKTPPAAPGGGKKCNVNASKAGGGGATKEYLGERERKKKGSGPCRTNLKAFEMILNMTSIDSEAVKAEQRKATAKVYSEMILTSTDPAQSPPQE